MNPKRMVEILLTKTSFKHNVFYLEQRTYKEGKVFKKYKVKIDNGKMQEFNSLTQLLLFLKDWKWWQLPKLTDRQKKKIIADYVDNGNYSETARINNTTDTTVRTIIKDNKDMALEKMEQKKQQNTKDILEYMEETKEKRKKVIDLCLEKMEERLNKDELMNIKDIATAYGVLVDKSLKVNEMNGNGNNSNINVPIIKLEVVDNSNLESVLYDNKE